MELGYRYALLKHIDMLHPEWEDLKKGAWIANRLGDYRNNSLFVQAMDAIGGPFVAFHFGIVPEQVAHAATHPVGISRIEQIDRSEQDVNSELLDQGNAQLDMGGPVDDAAKLLFNKKAYITSPNAIGPVASQFVGSDRDYPVSAGMQMQGLAREFPGVGTVEDLATIAGAPNMNPYYNRKYSGGVTPQQSSLAGLLGMYYTRKTKRRMRPTEKLIRKEK
jgi:hypothetical protein